LHTIDTDYEFYVKDTDESYGNATVFEKPSAWGFHSVFSINKTKQIGRLSLQCTVYINNILDHTDAKIPLKQPLFPHPDVQKYSVLRLGFFVSVFILLTVQKKRVNNIFLQWVAVWRY